MKKIKYILILFVMLISFSAYKIFALEGGNSSGNVSEMSSCSKGWCVNNGRYGVRFSLVDKNGNLIGNAADIFYKGSTGGNVNVTLYNRFTQKAYSNIKYFYWYHNGDYECIKNSNGACVAGSEEVAKLLWDYNGNTALDIVITKDSNFSSTLNARILGLKQQEAVFKKLISLMGVTTTTGDEYLIVEPTVAIMKNNKSPYYYGTVYDLYMSKLKNNKETGVSGVNEFLFTRLGNSMYSTKLSVGNVLAFNKPKSSKVSYNDWTKNTYGVAIYKVSDFIPPPKDPPTPPSSIKCEIGKNNNDEEKYNWIKYDSATQQMVKIEGGCCTNYNKKGVDGYNKNITEAAVKQNYPQCFSNPCTEQTTKVETGCNNNSRGSVSKTKTKLQGYCYTANKYYTGVINANDRIFYGCTYSDSLSLPQGYKKTLTLGAEFEWPTNYELLAVLPVDLDYEIKRTSTATCYAYQVDKTTGLSKPYSIGNTSYNKIKSNIESKVSFEDIRVEQNGQLAGVLEGAIDSSSVASDNTSPGFFYVDVESSYNQILDVEKNASAYRYFDNTTNKYMRYSDIVDKDKIKTYDIFPTMILPVDNNFNVKNDYQYGLSYDTSFGDITMSGSYNCTQKVKNDDSKCICPEGTENAGLDLSNYSKSSTGEVGECTVDNSSVCAVLQDEYCNNKDISYKCPNIDFDLTECINQKIAADSEKRKVKAYNECVYEKCSCTSDDCDYKKICNPDKEKTIYRTVFLDNPFVSNSGSSRIPGTNWGGKDSIDSLGKYTGLVDKYIISTKDYMYKGEPMYRIKLNAKAIEKVRDYNDSNDYDYFNLECDDTSGRCYSIFLHSDIKEYVSGTCGSIDNKKDFFEQFYTCREESFLQ